MVIVGNKDDCPELKVVEKGDAQRFAEQMGVQLYETSAKENQNIEEVFKIYTVDLPVWHIYTLKLEPNIFM